jgi:hypothetical protein
MLQSRGLSFEQAQQMAQNAGVDPNNPNELAAFARQNGVPENQIQQYLVQLREQQNSTSVSSGPTPTDLTETGSFLGGCAGSSKQCSNEQSNSSTIRESPK